MNANRISLNGLAFGMSPINEEASRSNLFDFSDLTKSNLPQPEFDAPSPVVGHQEIKNAEIENSTAMPKQQIVEARPFVPLIRLDRNIEQTRMEMTEEWPSFFGQKEETKKCEIGKENHETPAEMTSAPTPMRQTSLSVPMGQIISLDKNVEQTMMEMNTFHEQEGVGDAVAIVLDNVVEDLNNETLRKQVENQEMAIDLLKRELAAAEKKLAVANSHIDNFEELEAKMLLENFRLKKELLKLKVKFRMISVDEAAKELGCGSAEFVEEQNQ